jgi:hypothetical protein
MMGMARRSAPRLESTKSTSGSTEPRPMLVAGCQLLGERVGQGEPAYLVRRRNGREVRLSRLHYLIAACADGRRTPDELAAEVSTRYELPASADDVLRIIERRLRPAGIVQLRPGSSRQESIRGALALMTGAVVVLVAIAGLVGAALIAWPGGSDGGDSGARRAASARPKTTARPPAADGAARVPTRSARAAAAQSEPSAVAPPATPAAAPADTRPPISEGEARSLNDSAFALMRQGRYAEAIPDLRLAVAGLAGTGPADPYEAYANYNLGRSLLKVGRCAEARPPLERSNALQDRGEVTQALAEVDRCLARGGS